MKNHFDLETELQNLDLSGRNHLYTHLICQEIPFWISSIYEGEKISKAEVDTLILRRGFNKKETLKFRALAKFLNSHAKEIRKMESRESKANRYMRGFQKGVQIGIDQPLSEVGDISNPYNKGKEDGMEIVKKQRDKFLDSLDEADKDFADEIEGLNKNGGILMRGV